MSWSLGEIEGLARKAARGAGLPWGVAEEAGKAVRWLCAAGLPGDAVLAMLLQQNDGADADMLRPVDPTVTPWQARGGALCPLLSGAALCDLASDVSDVVLSRVSCPLLLVPYMAMAAKAAQTTLQVTWQGAQITRGAQGTRVQATPEALTLPEAQMLRIAPAGMPGGSPIRRGYRAAVAAETAEVLNRFAQRTYAPETEASRLSGAGAGLSDND